jgi:hypothetical protein
MTVKRVHLLLLLKFLKAISCFDKVITIFEGIFMGPHMPMGARVSSLGDCSVLDIILKIYLLQNISIILCLKVEFSSCLTQKDVAIYYYEKYI